MRYRVGSVALALLCACSEATIQQGMEERAANEIVAELSGLGFEPSAQPEGGRKQTWSVRVPSGERTAAIQELVRLGLPRQQQTSSAELLKPGLVPTPGEERQRHALALQGDLARTLEQLDGVLSARVHLSLPAPPRAGAVASGGARCSVLLRVRSPVARWSDRRRQDVRELVAGSVEGLSAEHVTLVLDELTQQSKPPPKRTSGESVRRWGLTALALAALGAVAWSSLGSLPGWIAPLLRRLRPRAAPQTPTSSTP